MFFILELTHDFNALPALLVGTVAALCVTVLLLRRSILTEKLARRGQHIAREYSVDVFERLRVRDVMDPHPKVVAATTTVTALAARLAVGDTDLSRRQGTIIVDARQNLVGLVTRNDLMKALQGPAPHEMPVSELVRRGVITVQPESTLHDAVALLLKHDIGRMPVVSVADPRRVVGYLGRADILAARMRLHDEEETREHGPWRRRDEPQAV
jgi:signal-transduction protein with cAMP-binding, CBS, and nucleotidyltransferase domain